MSEKVDMRALLEVAKCPCCDGSGGRYDNYGNAEQCQWCYERSVAIAAPPTQPDAALVEAAEAALKAIQDTLEDAYHNAVPECCGQAHLECCGSPIQAWDERDQKIMDRLAPHEKALRTALAGKGGQP